MLRSNALQRSSSSDTVASSPNDSEVSSLFDVARGSPSPGSASSDTDDSLDDVASKKAMSGKPIDTYGNEFQVPTFTMKEIHAAIPARCFERSIAMGLYYFARDLVLLGTAFAICHRYITPENIPSTLVRGVMWALYTFVQGLFGTGLWIIGHECGHGALMPSKTLNNSVGFVAHSILLAPFFSWKLSHSRHHKATGHMERDMAFLPRTREQYASRVGVMAHQLADMGEETPLAAAINLLGQQVAGFPLYLMTNFTGNDNHESQPEGRGKGKHNGFFTGVNHFNPSSPLYKNSEASSIVLSDLGLAAVVAIMSVVAMKNSWADVAVWYIIPWMWVNSWIVAITYLQHTDPSLPHYAASSWTFARGAAATIDREFGFVGRNLFHGIIETHVLHHLVSTIPFYNAEEATEAIKPVMGIHYKSDQKDGMRGFLSALWKVNRWCQWVEPSGDAKDGVLVFRNRNGLGVKPM